jgi:hypothetical protein
MKNLRPLSQRNLVTKATESLSRKARTPQKTFLTSDSQRKEGKGFQNIFPEILPSRRLGEDSNLRPMHGQHSLFPTIHHASACEDHSVDTCFTPDDPSPPESIILLSKQVLCLAGCLCKSFQRRLRLGEKHMKLVLQYEGNVQQTALDNGSLEDVQIPQRALPFCKTSPQQTVVRRKATGTA